MNSKKTNNIYIDFRDPSFATRFGFIEFADAEAAQRACEMTGVELDGRKLRITLSKAPITPSTSTGAQQQQQQVRRREGNGGMSLPNVRGVPMAQSRAVDRDTFVMLQLSLL